MAAEFDDTGTVNDISKDKCSVIVKIGSKDETLSFGKKTLYSFGIQCEEDMTNVLEVGMEVDLCYRFPTSGNKPIVLAVWIGDKPDSDALYSELQKAVFGQEGLVDQILEDSNYLVSCDSMLFTVIVRKDVVYRDGCPSSTELCVGERIVFDAFPSESVLSSGAKYQATCAWTGNQPRLVDRFSRNANKTTRPEKVKFLRTKLIEGTVLVIPNDVVAFVEPEVQDVADMVILFRSSFSDKRERIQEIVEVGERLHLRLRFGILFRGKRQWFAAKAWKYGQEIPAEDQMDEKLVELESLAFNAQISDKSANVSRRTPSPASIVTIPTRVPVAGSQYPNFYGTPTNVSAYPAAWQGYSNSGMYPVNARVFPANAGSFPTPYPNSTGIPIGLVGVPLVRYVCSTYFTGNPCTYAQLPVPASVYLGVQARLPSNTSMVENVPRSVNTDTASLAERSASEHLEVIHANDRSKVMLAEPDARFTSKSKILFGDPPLMGTIGHVISKNQKVGKKFRKKATISYGNILIVAKRKDVYINGQNCTIEQFSELIASGTNVVYFEAQFIQCSSNQKGNKGIHTHFATCVWVGQKPTFTELLSDMKKPDLSLLEIKDTIFIGRIKKICLPDMAFADLVCEKSIVCIHISAFGCRPKSVQSEYVSGGSIAHFVKLRQWISFKIVSVAACPIILNAIDVKFVDKKYVKRARALHKKSKNVSENSTNVSLIESVSTDDDASSDSETYGDSIPSIASHADNSFVSHPESAASSGNLSCLRNEPKSGTESPAVSSSTNSGNSYQATVFMAHSKRQEMPTRFLNCSGKLQIEREDGLSIYKVQPASGFPSTLVCTPKVFDFCRRFNTAVAERDCSEIKFNAECRSSGNKVDFSINRIWWDSKVNGEDMLCTDLARDESPKFEYNVPLRAVVSSITQHDAAVTMFDHTPIIVPLEALHLNNQCPKRNEFTAVDQFLKKGDDVILADVKTRFFISKSSIKLYYYVAGSCWKAKKLGPSQWDEIKLPETQEEPSWLDRWLCGECSREGRVVKRGNRHLVDFVSSKIDGLNLSLDVFEHSKFFVNETPIELDPSSDLENCEIKFHVAHRRDPQNSDNVSEEFFVKYAWIGDDPNYLNVLKDELEVPDGLVVDGWNYVAVIEDFVLPSHMICKIGVVPVVVPFPQIHRDMPESAVEAHRSKRRNSQVGVKVRETFYKGHTFLESDSVTNTVTVFDDNDVLIACKGEVIVPPRPEGIIRSQATKTDAYFHLCSVLPIYESGLIREQRFEYFKHLRSIIKEGTKVCFNAAKHNEKERMCDYYAYEVWLD